MASTETKGGKGPEKLTQPPKLGNKLKGRMNGDKGRERQTNPEEGRIANPNKNLFG